MVTQGEQAFFPPMISVGICICVLDILDALDILPVPELPVNPELPELPEFYRERTSPSVSSTPRRMF
ncbi:MAG: hypothetical protein IJU61_08625, partial [Victivallales bacterium]|nr:hypothetical protein [Victivallales bacterium]